MSCPLCSDGWRATPAGMVRCPCMAELRKVRQLEAAGIPARYQTRSIDSFDGKVSPSAGAAAAIARGYVKDFPVHRDTGLMFTGPVGTGKTHLAIGILLACHEQFGATVRFVELRELFAQIKETFSAAGRTEAQLTRPLLECDILAIDEVGATRDTDWQRETTEKLINGRYNANLATLCTTNYANLPPGGMRATSPPFGSQSAGAGSFASQASIVAGTAVRQDTLGDRIGAPMWSRLQEMCRAVEMHGEDQRTKRRRA